MKQTIFRVESNTALTDSVFRMTLLGDTSAVTAPGQFVNLKLDGFFLRRPISVCDCEDGRLTLIFKTVGKGTAQMSRLPAGAEIDTLTGLGNGYDLTRAGDRPLLLGGGVGVPPLYWLAKKLRAEGKAVTAVLGFNTEKEIFGEKEFRALGCDTRVTTADGSHGIRGFVTDALPESYSFFYTCGPMPMLKAVSRRTVTDGQFSFEERMGCGFGACMGCSQKTKNGYKRICREGPVLEKEEILWED